MQTTVSVSLNIKSTKNFEQNIAKFFPKGSEISINNITLFSFSGYGQYKDYLSLSVNGKDFRIHNHHTNSMQKDWYSSGEFDNLSERTKDNFIKGKVLGIIENNLDYVL